MLLVALNRYTGSYISLLCVAKKGKGENGLQLQSWQICIKLMIDVFLSLPECH